MKKKLSILLAAAMILALASCSTGDQTSAGSTSSTGSVSASTSGVTSSEPSSSADASTSGASSSASSSKEEKVMDTLFWTTELPDPGEGIEYVELNDADTVMQIHMDGTWTAEDAKAYVAQCLELGFELYDEAEPDVGIYYSEGYHLEKQIGFLVTCDMGVPEIVLSYGDQMYFY